MISEITNIGNAPMSSADAFAAPALLLKRGALPDVARCEAILKLSVIPDSARAAAGYLDLEVTHLGEDGGGAFEAYWDGAWIETNPPGITIVLGHRATSALQRGAAKAILSIDVRTALFERPNLWAMVVADGTMSPAVELHLETSIRSD